MKEIFRALVILSILSITNFSNADVLIKNGILSKDEAYQNPNMQAALEYEKKGSYQQAENLYEKEIKAYNPYAYFALGNLYREEKLTAQPPHPAGNEQTKYFEHIKGGLDILLKNSENQVDKQIILDGITEVAKLMDFSVELKDCEKNKSCKNVDLDPVEIFNVSLNYKYEIIKKHTKIVGETNKGKLMEGLGSIYAKLDSTIERENETIYTIRTDAEMFWDENYFRAKELYVMAIEYGSIRAMLNLAYLYENGLGVRQNKFEARELYGLACDNGKQEGCDNYKRLNGN